MGIALVGSSPLGDDELAEVDERDGVSTVTESVATSARREDEDTRRPVCSPRVDAATRGMLACNACDVAIDDCLEPPTSTFTTGG
jgi:hypothetical protein